MRKIKKARPSANLQEHFKRGFRDPIRNQKPTERVELKTLQTISATLLFERLLETYIRVIKMLDIISIFSVRNKHSILYSRILLPSLLEKTF